MELGQRIKKARLEAGLSQRQLCGDAVTRNMLSQIENGSARPSMDTLRYFAAQLGKPVSFFLEEDTVASPNPGTVEAARNCYIRKDYEAALQQLQQYRGPDPVCDAEKGLLELLCLTELAEQALRDRRRPYAVQLLQDAEAAASATPYDTPQLRRRRQLLLARAEPQRAGELLALLPPEDDELLLRSGIALDRGDAALAAGLLAAAQNRETEEWVLLSGRAAMEQGDYAAAIGFFQRLEALCPDAVLPHLERCCRELENYKMAYHYACLQRDRK